MRKFLSQAFQLLAKNLEGELLLDDVALIIYSTDASAYKERPLAVVFPKNTDDLKKIIHFASEKSLGLIPRAGGTSLAGQVVGNGIVVDVSRHLTRILEINKEEHWVRVQPGVVLDDLNKHLESFDLMFGPETSTANRCTIGGMVGNNACGAHSIIYGSTRDHLLETTCILSNGSEVVFKNNNTQEFLSKCNQNNFEAYIYKGIYELLKPEDVRKEIASSFPDPELKRRNTGYAIDILSNSQIFNNNSHPFNMNSLIAGSEGTLAFITEIKLNLVQRPKGIKFLIAAHFNALEDALEANIIALKQIPQAIELMDKTILDCTKNNIEQNKNRFFIEGDPAAILIIEFLCTNEDEINNTCQSVEREIRKAGYGYHFSRIIGPDIEKIWSLRKAGLGVLSNIPGDAKPVSVIEDTAVNPKLLPSYVADFKKLLIKHKLDAVFHGHAATGELHLRPVLNLKDQKDVEKFYTLAVETAQLVRKYKGSLSGEHGDGRLRGQFIQMMVGERNYELLRSIKNLWDPKNIFNPGKILNTPNIKENLRYNQNIKIESFPETIFDFSDVKGLLRMAENCNGSADCRKSELSGGTMCPSYMATRDERYTTRARANLLREVLTNSANKEPFNSREIFEILDYCLSCKACKSECPSNVDMAKLKAEFLYQYNKFHKIPLRQKLIAYQPDLYKVGSYLPGVFNFIVTNKIISYIFKYIAGIAVQRQIPRLKTPTLRKWCKMNIENLNAGLKSESPELFFFIDEFTNYLEPDIGITAMLLLNSLGYRIFLANHAVSGRTFISKGLLKKAKKIANSNVRIFAECVSGKIPLVGIEPSALLTFRDEYPVLVDIHLRSSAEHLALNSYTLEEFIANEFDQGRIKSSSFTKEPKEIKLHCHCHQKSISSSAIVRKVLSIPSNYQVSEIPSGCCGMAGSFGYEKKHYKMSVNVSELVLFPEIRKTKTNKIDVVATGISCRQQIKEGLKLKSFHPTEILFTALKRRSKIST